MVQLKYLGIREIFSHVNRLHHRPDDYLDFAEIRSLENGKILYSFKQAVGFILEVIGIGSR